MLAKERQQQIVQLVNHQGSVQVKDLAIQFSVTEDCIRKDLTLLQKEHLLKKTYGGAMCIRENRHLFSSQERKSLNNSEHLILASKAVSIIQPQDTLFLDISLTSIEIAKELLNYHESITVITNMIDVLNILTSSQNIHLIFIGGQLNTTHDGFWGSYTIKQIKQFKIDKAFIGVVGIDFKTGDVSTYEVDDGLCKEAIISQSQFTYLLCEKRKLKEDGNYIYTSLNAITHIIMSEKINEKELEQFNVILV